MMEQLNLVARHNRKQLNVYHPNCPDERKIADHGLVYAHYYFLMIGNKLLELGLYK